jgi:hypothetical protein
MALSVALGGELIGATGSDVAAVPSDPDPERTRDAAAALARLVEANAPGSASPACQMSDGPDGIDEPCRR